VNHHTQLRLRVSIHGFVSRNLIHSCPLLRITGLLKNTKAHTGEKRKEKKKKSDIPNFTLRKELLYSSPSDALQF
jgi:hypothetical protein